VQALSAQLPNCSSLIRRHLSGLRTPWLALLRAARFVTDPDRTIRPCSIGRCDWPVGGRHGRALRRRSQKVPIHQNSSTAYGRNW
jgi:hypothetical protein